MTREIATTDLESVQIGPVAVARLSREAAIRRLLAVPGSGSRLAVAFANAHGLLLAMDDPAFADALSRFLVLNDGIGAEIGARLLSGTGFEDNLNGTDFVPALLDAAPVGTRVYLFGARPEVVEKAAGLFAARHPAIAVCGWRSGYFGEDELPQIVAGINAARPDILLVAMGNPRQELLIDRLWDDLDVPLALGVGALFDFTAGEVTRAPSLMRSNGLEWVYRLGQEPKRLGQRYTTGILRYLWKILRLKLSGKSARA
ncbi:WecB/TagA/CpsF family glycosyltransferase [Stappia indica]|uniref:WecB/TagA/CpsF family glycosyltransferase n=1 Tax=Stappia indica TaxID=538381 RepID=A0A857CA79_9HYPH|nr:WecB/TagA/CpsF family glycosyltransferase [Stappia indica]QGZ35930.1 WecB/TagA/CpsF family glycosyltransferase [Stappia indica]